MKLSKSVLLSSFCFTVNCFFLLFIQTVYAVPDKVDSEIYSRLENNQEARVIVILADKTPTVSQYSRQTRKKRVLQKQNKVLKSVNRKNFRLKHKYKSLSALSGFITKKGLKDLENSPDIDRIQLDRKTYATLSESIPLINAEEVGSLGYTGQGTTVCVLDTGVDYTHSALGGSECTIIPVADGIIEEYILESSHPYGNDYTYTWTITKPGYTSIAVHFQQIDLEQNSDFINILDADNNMVQVFNGSYGDIWSDSVSGDTIKIQIVSDSSGTDWGFSVDEILNGSVSMSWENCGNIIAGYDFVNSDHDPYDDNNHGTHVTGIISSKNSIYQGIAPGANIIALKVLGADGTGWFSDTAAAIDWCIEHKETYGISVISMSLSDGLAHDDPQTDCDQKATAISITAAVNEGIFIVVASGNEAFTDGIGFPACATDAVSVGNVYDESFEGIGWASCTDQPASVDQIVCHTNRNELLDLLAPGALITSTIPGGGFAIRGGTSMATPHVAGIAALLLEKDPTLTPYQIKTALHTTGVDVLDPETGLTFPRVDALAAINSSCVSSEEICDGIDNNCNGEVDEELTQLCGSTDEGVCEYGTETCSAGEWINCTAIFLEAETCNSLDDNCDGIIDDGCDNDTDGIEDPYDNCPVAVNPDQYDVNSDGEGDACDTDTIFGYVTGSAPDVTQVVLTITRLSCGGDVVQCTVNPDADGYYACSILGAYKNYGVKSELDSCTFDPLLYYGIVVPRTEHSPYNFSANCN